jgi:hypothetical protein
VHRLLSGDNRPSLLAVNGCSNYWESFFTEGLVRYPQTVGEQHLVRTSLMMQQEVAISNLFQKIAPYGWQS